VRSHLGFGVTQICINEERAHDDFGLTMRVLYALKQFKINLSLPSFVLRKKQ